MKTFRHLEADYTPNDIGPAESNFKGEVNPEKQAFLESCGEFQDFTEDDIISYRAKHEIFT